MQGTILDFLKLATEKPELASELVGLAKKYDFEFTVPDEVSDDDLEQVSGGTGIARGPTVTGSGYSGEGSMLVDQVSIVLRAASADATAQAGVRDAAAAMRPTDKESEITAKEAGGRS